MVRLARFSADSFLTAAVALVAEGGPSAATMAAIARRAGAPTGSVYHRFESRAALLAAAWARIHAGFAAAVLPHLRAGDGLAAALAIPAWCRRDPQGARVLLLNEAGALFEDAPLPDAARAEIARQEEEMDAAFRDFMARATGGLASEEAAARARFLVFDGPIALLRPHLLAGAAVPDHVDAMIADIHRAVAVAPRRTLARTA